MVLKTGDQFDHFEIRSHIARGGMGDIYSAVDLNTSCGAVLKIPDIKFIGDPAYYDRFQNELAITSALDHPAVQKGIGSGNYNGMPYLVTQFVQGEPLRERLLAGKPLSPGETLALIRQIAQGLAYCHALGVIHRDVKPENILVNTDGQPVLLDFGLALSNNGRRRGQGRDSVGTPEYMSPEQIEGRPADMRSDIYSLGIMLFEMLSGHLPFRGESALALAAQQLHAPTPLLEVPGVSMQIATVVARCMQRRADDRYPNMGALIHDLDHLEEVDSTRLGVMSGPATARPYHRSPFVLPFVVSGALVALLIIVGVILQALHSYVH
ncbi:MAG TPA: serine/threonine-protein kinase [Bacteroidota bacterium]|nr:serine/threonine-protein kinase [Bacteroidota bacterium]